MGYFSTPTYSHFNDQVVRHFQFNGTGRMRPGVIWGNR